MGVTAVSQLCPEYVAESYMVTMPHEMSSWVNMPGQRIQ
jgi:hypothetical protein